MKRNIHTMIGVCPHHTKSGSPCRLCQRSHNVIYFDENYLGSQIDNPDVVLFTVERDYTPIYEIGGK